uniref:Canopy homolog 2 n=1 Tax=Caligus rogercresseyi TaxID=217165 RepID=C1BNL2_CALRO|nr:canopy homolog 2 precursor [Caligus rogercresseyi]
MRVSYLLVLSIFLSLSTVIQAKKSKRSKGKVSTKQLKCLVCRALSNEIDAYIAAIDPSKKTETGTFRVDSNGRQGKVIIPYARSEESLHDMVDKVCERFNDYAQATEKSSGKFSVIPLTTPTGNMNPDFGNYDVLPDDELNKKLLFHCQGIVEDLEEDILELYVNEEAKKLDSKLCSAYCSKRNKVEL